VTEYCAVIGTHSTVRGDKLLYGQIPDLFPRCGIGSGHARLPCDREHSWGTCLVVVLGPGNGHSTYTQRMLGANGIREEWRNTISQSAAPSC